MPDHKGFELQQLVNFQKFSTLRVNVLLTFCVADIQVSDIFTGTGQLKQDLQHNFSLPAADVDMLLNSKINFTEVRYNSNLFQNHMVECSMESFIANADKLTSVIFVQR